MCSQKNPVNFPDDIIVLEFKSGTGEISIILVRLSSKYFTKLLTSMSCWYQGK